MNAIVSGRSGCAVVFDEGSLASIHVDEPYRVVPRTPGDLLHLLGEASDLRFLEDVDTEAVRAELETVSAQEEALSLFLILLDAEQPRGLRGEAAGALEELLDGSDPETPAFASRAAAEHLARVLYARSFPPSADAIAAGEICGEGGLELLGSFVQALIAAQPVVTDVERAWESIPLAAFGGSGAERSRQLRLAVRSGCFSAAAAAVTRTGRLELPANAASAILPDVLARWRAAYEVVRALRERGRARAAAVADLPAHGIQTRDLERLIHRPNRGTPVLSLFLDMSTDGNHKRSHHVFLGRMRDRLDALGASGPGSTRTSLFERVLEWIDREFDESSRGLVIYAEVDGGWWEALQFPVPVQDRLVVGDGPDIGPLAQVLDGYEHYGVILLDREQVRIVSVHLGTPLDEPGFRGGPAAAPAGGYAHTRFQRRRLDEMRHFFREFAGQVERFVVRYEPRHLVLLGTQATLDGFLDLLPPQVVDRVVYAGAWSADGLTPGVPASLEPHLRNEMERHAREVIEEVRDRAAHDYLATSGVQGTLAALQEGKVDTLVLAKDGQMQGVRCAQCGFIFVRPMTRCPYDGSEQLEPVDVREEMMHLARQQGAEVQLTEAKAMPELRGAAALLRS